MLEFRFDTQLLIEGHGLDEDAIHDYILANIAGDCLLAVGDEDLIKIHFHTNTPGRCSNTAPASATSTTSSSKTWSVRKTACTAERSGRENRQSVGSAGFSYFVCS